MRKHESSQQVVSGELEKQTHCLELNVTLEALEAELLHTEENKMVS